MTTFIKKAPSSTFNCSLCTRSIVRATSFLQENARSTSMFQNKLEAGEHFLLSCRVSPSCWQLIEPILAYFVENFRSEETSLRLTSPRLALSFFTKSFFTFTTLNEIIKDVSLEIWLKILIEERILRENFLVCCVKSYKRH